MPIAAAAFIAAMHYIRTRYPHLLYRQVQPAPSEAHSGELCQDTHPPEPIILPEERARVHPEPAGTIHANQAYQQTQQQQQQQQQQQTAHSVPQHQPQPQQPSWIPSITTVPVVQQPQYAVVGPSADQPPLQSVSYGHVISPECAQCPQHNSHNSLPTAFGAFSDYTTQVATVPSIQQGQPSAPSQQYGIVGAFEMPQIYGGTNPPQQQQQQQQQYWTPVEVAPAAGPEVVYAVVMPQAAPPPGIFYSR